MAECFDVDLTFPMTSNLNKFLLRSWCEKFPIHCVTKSYKKIADKVIPFCQGACTSQTDTRDRVTDNSS